MKTLITTIAAVVMVGCATPTQSPNPPLFDAVKKGDIEAVRKHLDAGADVNTKDEDGYTLLIEAVSYGSKEIVELLIFNGVDVNVFDLKVRGIHRNIRSHRPPPPQTRRQDGCRIESRREIKHILITTISALLLAYI